MHTIIKFFHHLFNSHCPACELEREREESRRELAKECKSCDTLRQLLEGEKFEKQKLLNFLLSKNVPVTETQEIPKPALPFQALGSTYKSNRMIRESLESADRARAFALGKEKQQQEYEASRKKSTDELENELLKDVKEAGIKEDAEVSNG